MAVYRKYSAITITGSDMKMAIDPTVVAEVL